MIAFIEQWDKTMQGRLVVFEGCEGCGKTTQLERSHQWLIDSGWLAQLQKAGVIQHVVKTREPGGTELGQAIRQLLLDPLGKEPIQDRTELLLYAADRAQHVEGFLHPLLAEGALILCDRYIDSTIAYQGYGRGLDQNLIHTLNQIATNGLQSDLTFWLDVEVETGLARAQRRSKRDRMEQADLAFHTRVHQGFAQLAAQNRDRMIRIDASPSADQVFEQIQAILQEKLASWYGD
jgi:dTMP kinase